MGCMSTSTARHSPARQSSQMQASKASASCPRASTARMSSRSMRPMPFLALLRLQLARKRRGLPHLFAKVRQAVDLCRRLRGAVRLVQDLAPYIPVEIWRLSRRVWTWISALAARTGSMDQSSHRHVCSLALQGRSKRRSGSTADEDASVPLNSMGRHETIGSTSAANPSRLSMPAPRPTRLSLPLFQLQDSEPMTSDPAPQSVLAWMGTDPLPPPPEVTLSARWRQRNIRQQEEGRALLPRTSSGRRRKQLIQSTAKPSSSASSQQLQGSGLSPLSHTSFASARVRAGSMASRSCRRTGGVQVPHRAMGRGGRG